MCALRRNASVQLAESGHQQLLTCPLIPSPQAVWRPETTEPSTGPFKGPRGPWGPTTTWRPYHRGRTRRQRRSRGLHSALLKPFFWWASPGRGQRRWVWRTQSFGDRDHDRFLSLDKLDPFVECNILPSHVPKYQYNTSNYSLKTTVLKYPTSTPFLWSPIIIFILWSIWNCTMHTVVEHRWWVFKSSMHGYLCVIARQTINCGL